MSRNKVHDSGGTTPQMAVSTEEAKKKFSMISVSTTNSSQFGGMTFLSDKNKTRNTIRDSVKLTVIVLPTLIATAILAYMNINSAGQIKSDADSLSSNLKVARRVTSLVTNLAKERGMSCVLLSADKTDLRRLKDIERSVTKLREETDDALDLVTTWLGRPNDGKIYRSRRSFSRAIYAWRVQVSAGKPTCPENLESYTDKIKVLIAQAMGAFKRTKHGPFWLGMEAYFMILWGKDKIGLQRAYGQDYFLKGRHETGNHINFIGLAVGEDSIDICYSYSLRVGHKTMGNGGTGNMIMEQVGNSLPTEGNAWLKLQNSNEKFQKIQKFIEIITKNEGVALNPDIGASWFDLITDELSYIGNIEENIQSFLQNSLNETRNEAELEYRQSMNTVIIAGILCPILSVIYTIDTKKLMNKIHAFGQEMADKSRLLHEEKKLSESLLYQMLPKSVAIGLKQGLEIPTEYYDSVTIMFSDVIGFSALSQKCEPIEIVGLLNALYNTFDGIIDRYNVYKVETISDSYMVASGLPERNGDRHSNEICTMALNILMSMKDFEIPHIPGESLIIRAGVNTGTVCTGVVGTKMPRYCLFGDTVNTASRMETTGLGMRIHLSGTTESHLMENNPEVFKTEYRGEVEVKGKGLVDTFWLIGKKGFPYKVNLRLADEIIEKTTYFS